MLGGREEYVRLIGIDTPEVYNGVDCGGPESSASMKRMLEPGDRVKLVRDPSQGNRDTYDRLLRYVEFKGHDLGRRQVTKGWANVYVFDDPFQAAQPLPPVRGSGACRGARRLGRLRRLLSQFWMRPPRRSEIHLSYRSGWLRAAVLGANDGIVSTASLLLGVAASGASGAAIVTAGIAGLVAGALSMAAGEYVSVSSQRDSERADLQLERRELKQDPEGELLELTQIYERRGVPRELAREVAQALSANDALAAHARDELGFDQARRAQPFQAAWTSALAFASGAGLPVVAVAVAPADARVVACIAVTIMALALLGFTGARLGGGPRLPATARVISWGLVAMAVTAGIGAVVGAVV